MGNNDSKKNSDSKGESEIHDDGKVKLSEALKKVFTVGVSAAFMTEESVRNYLSELKIPKEILNVVLQGAQKSKDEITQRVTKEVVSIIDKVDFVKEFSKFAETHTFKITAEIDIKKKQTGPTTEETDKKV